MSDNGSWTGRDPRLRLLRTLAFLVILCLLVYVVVVEGARDVATLGTLAGMLLVFGGFEAGIRWPSFNRREEAYTPPLEPLDPPEQNEWDAP